jgi:hypothetical protein
MEGGAVRHNIERGPPQQNLFKFGSAVSEEKI